MTPHPSLTDEKEIANPSSNTPGSNLVDTSILSEMEIPIRFRIPQEIADAEIRMPQNAVWAWRMLFLALASLEDDQPNGEHTFVFQFAHMMAAFGRSGGRNYEQFRKAISDLEKMRIILKNGEEFRLGLSSEVDGCAWEVLIDSELSALFHKQGEYAQVCFTEIGVLRTNLDMLLYLRIKRLACMHQPVSVLSTESLKSTMPGRETGDGKFPRALRTAIGKVATALGRPIAYELKRGRGTRQIQYLVIGFVSK